MAGLDLQTILIIAGLLAIAGGVTGVLAGLFGVGGGAIVVPVLYEVFGMIDVPDEVRMPLAVGTSLAIIIPTSIQSARGHFKRGAVDMAILKSWLVPVVLGVVLGSFIASFADPWVFKVVFVLVAGTNAIKLLFGRESWKLGDSLPGGIVRRIMGFFVGLFSALMGIGGGAISNLLFTLYGKPIRESVATSAGVGVLISIPGAIGYVLAGWGKAGLPPLSLGFVSVLAFVLLVPTTVLTTRIGVRLAHSIPKRRLEVLFGLFLAATCARFIWALVSP
jgi:uncharacterized membrane protein YfcA